MIFHDTTHAVKSILWYIPYFQRLINDLKWRYVLKSDEWKQNLQILRTKQRLAALIGIRRLGRDYEHERELSSRPEWFSIVRGRPSVHCAPCCLGHFSFLLSSFFCGFNVPVTSSGETTHKIWRVCCRSAQERDFLKFPSLFIVFVKPPR